MASEQRQQQGSSAPPIQNMCHYLLGRYTCLACDRESNLLAVGCDTGQIAIIKEDPEDVKIFSCPGSSSVEKISFADGKGLLLIVLKNNSLYLWDFSKNALKPIQKISEDTVVSVTCVTWSRNNYFYVGTNTGTVKILEMKKIAPENVDETMEDSARSVKEIQPVWSNDFFSPKIGKGPFDGNVIAIQERKEGNTFQVLMASSKGDCVVWTRSGTEKPEFKFSKIEKEPLNVWWTPAGKKVVANKTGLIRIYEVESSSDAISFQCNGKDKIPISNVKQRLGAADDADEKKWLIYSGGCKPEDNIDESRILSIMLHVKKSYKILATFGSRIVDFHCLNDGKLLAVLTESELVMLETENNWQSNKFSVKRSRKYPYLTSPVTCLQHCGPYVKQETEGKLASELIATGHLDGSVRLWLCYGDNFPFSFECHLVLYTADYFNLSQLKEFDIKQITLVKVSNSQKYMNVVNKSGHVLLFGFGQQQQSDKPPSYEVILNDEEDQPASQTATQEPPIATGDPPTETQSPKSLSTPPPYFRPCQWQKKDAQLLHHFSCYYRMNGTTTDSTSVAVNCVDYNEYMEIWSVGTSKGLIILDLPQKLLLNVIGSEKKLLEKSGLNSKSNPSAKKCDVVCVETVPEISLTAKASQTSLWVATADKALGVFTIDSSESTENDRLQKTGNEIKIKRSSAEIVDILHFKTPKSDDVMACVNMVLVYKTGIKKYVYEQDICYNDKKSEKRENFPSSILKSGILDKDHVPYVACLLEKNRLYILPLYELGSIPRNIPLDVHESAGKVLFSTGGQHAVWCTKKAVQCYCPF